MEKRKKKKTRKLHHITEMATYTIISICTALGFSSAAAFRSDPLAHWESWGQKDQMKEK
jgi:hypothetical protein